MMAALVSGGLWVGLLGTLHLNGMASPIDRFETVLLDARIDVLGQRFAPETVAIVAVDDATVESAGGYPLDRKRLAELIDRIDEAGARALAIDMLFLGTTTAEADMALAASLRRLPVVIAAAARFPGQDAHSALVPVPREVLKPVALFEEAASLGLVNVVTDAGGTPRHIPMLYRSNGSPELSMALRATGLYDGELPGITANGLSVAQRSVPLDLGWHLPLNYYGPAGTIETISALDLLRNADANRLLQDRLVVLGATAVGVGDRFATPFDQIMPGVEVLATGMSNLLDGSALRRDKTVRRIDLAASMVITLLGIFAMSVLPLAMGSIACLAVLLLWFAVITVAYSQFYWLSGALPLTASLPPVAAIALSRQIFDRRHMRQLMTAQEALGQFQSATFATRIAQDPSFLLEPREQHAAILFVDLVGFTGISERLGPSRTRDVLKTFHTMVADESERQQGLIMDFMGDGVMVGFGIPDTGPRDAPNAATAAFELVRSINEWLLRQGLTAKSAVRVGAHCGPVVLSRLGHERHQQIAATGDCVNVASRLVEAARASDSAIALSSDLFKRARSQECLLPDTGRFEQIEIRGRQERIEVCFWSAAEIATRPLP